MARPRSASSSSSSDSEPASLSPEMAAVSFEEAMGELEDIVHALESEPLPLDDLVGKYERGMSLLRQCRRQIDSAQLRIEQITRRGDDAAAAVPFPASAATAVPFSSSAEPVPASPSAAVPASAPVPSPSARSKPAAAAVPSSADDDDEIRLF